MIIEDPIYYNDYHMMTCPLGEEASVSKKI